MLEAVLQPDGHQELLGGVPCLAVGPSRYEGRHHRVFQYGKLRQEVVELENEPHFTIAEDRQLRIRKPEDILPAVAHQALSRPIKGAHYVQQRALACPARPDNAEHLSPLDHQVDPVQDLHAAFAEGKKLLDPLNADLRCPSAPTRFTHNE